MWLTQTAYLETQKALLQVIAERDAIRQQQAALVNTNEWLMVRVTQLEHERAVFLRTQFGVSIAAPTIQRADPVSQLDLNQTISFADMGDEEALRQGIGWDEHGSVLFNTNVKTIYDK